MGACCPANGQCSPAAAHDRISGRLVQHVLDVTAIWQLPGAPLRQQLPNSRNQFNRDFYSGVCRGLVRRLVLGNRFVVGLLFVVRNRALYPRFVPTSWIFVLLHDDFRLRRSAFNAFGPMSYAVITNTDPGSGSGT